jgi:hypothetical protein
MSSWNGCCSYNARGLCLLGASCLVSTEEKHSNWQVLKDYSQGVKNEQ